MHVTRRFVVIVGVLAAAIVVAIVVLALHRQSGPSSYLYSDVDKAYLLQWDHSGVGTLWATYVDPSNGFQVSSRSQQVSVTRQGSAVSIDAPGETAPVLGHRDGGNLSITLNSGSVFGPWQGEFSFSHGSLVDYETALGNVQLQGTTIANEASTYATYDPRNANSNTIDTATECIAYLSGTDVGLVMHSSSQPACVDFVNRIGDLGSGGSWATVPNGQNYPGEASLVCEYADAHAETFLTVSDAGFQQYGGTLCSDVSSAGGWFALR